MSGLPEHRMASSVSRAAGPTGEPGLMGEVPAVLDPAAAAGLMTTEAAALAGAGAAATAAAGSAAGMEGRSRCGKICKVKKGLR